MPIGKLNISRGYETGVSTATAPRLALVPRDAGPPPKAKPAATLVSTEYQPAHDRLAALERLAKLAKQGALTPEEFAFEKARILGHSANALVLELPAPSPRASGPSLASRMFSWKFLPVGLAAGLGLSFASQPQETIRFFDETLRLLGA